MVRRWRDDADNDEMATMMATMRTWRWRQYRKHTLLYHKRNFGTFGLLSALFFFNAKKVRTKQNRRRFLKRTPRKVCRDSHRWQWRWDDDADGVWTGVIENLFTNKLVIFAANNFSLVRRLPYWVTGLPGLSLAQIYLRRKAGIRKKQKTGQIFREEYLRQKFVAWWRSNGDDNGDGDGMGMWMGMGMGEWRCRWRWRSRWRWTNIQSRNLGRSTVESHQHSWLFYFRD